MKCRMCLLSLDSRPRCRAASSGRFLSGAASTEIESGRVRVAYTMLIVHVYITLPERFEPSGPEAGLWTGFGQLAAALVEPFLAGVGPLGRRGRRFVLALQQVPDRVDLGPRDRPLRAYRAGDAAVEELPVWKLSYAIDVMLISTQGIACCSTSTW